MSGMHGMGGPGQPAMPGMNVDLKALAASPDFDRAFIQAMIPHHQSAIAMSRAATPNLKRPEIRDLAHDIITTQQVDVAIGVGIAACARAEQDHLKRVEPRDDPMGHLRDDLVN